jgi:hypothetical protein
MGDGEAFCGEFGRRRSQANAPFRAGRTIEKSSGGYAAGLSASDRQAGGGDGDALGQPASDPGRRAAQQ